MSMPRQQLALGDTLGYTEEQRRLVLHDLMSYAGRIGGQSRSKRKIAAVRKNIQAARKRRWVKDETSKQDE